jgi:DNA-binding SARP family transcriptional activator
MGAYVIDTGLSFSLFGPLRIRHGKHDLTVGPRLQQAVLAVLVMSANQVVTSTQILEWVWGDRLPPTGSDVIPSYVYRLRRTLTPFPNAGRVLRREGSGYLLAVDTAQVDLLRVETAIRRGLAARAGGNHAVARDLLVDALGEWSAEPLCGLPGPYADQQRRRLAELRLTAMLAWVDIEFELGGHERVLPELSALRSAQPLHEQVAGRLMTALSATGRQAEALIVYTETRTALITELGIEPSAELSRIHTAVLRGDREVAVPTDAVTASPASGGPDTGPAPDVRTRPADGVAPAPARYVLPTGAHHLVGRDTELDALLADVPPDPWRRLPRIDAVYGMPGAGKTALAVETARRLAGRYPDGQFYVDLRGSEPGREPTTVEEALTELLRATGFQQVPAERSRLVALWRSALADRRVVVVLDDARDTDQVRDLLPPDRHSRVLVTGQHHLLGLDATTVTMLGGLSMADAITLLGAAAGGTTTISDRTAHDVVELSRGLPAALRAVGTRMQHRPDWGRDQIVDRLRGRPHAIPELGVLVGKIGHAYGRLRPVDRMLLRAAAGDEDRTVDPVRVGESLGLPVNDVLDGCDRLYDASLLLIAGPGRFEVHPLVRAYVARYASAD